MPISHTLAESINVGMDALHQHRYQWIHLPDSATGTATYTTTATVNAGTVIYTADTGQAAIYAAEESLNEESFDTTEIEKYIDSLEKEAAETKD